MGRGEMEVFSRKRGEVGWKCYAEKAVIGKGKRDLLCCFA